MFQVSCLGEQDDHLQIPVYSKAGLSSCCAISVTLAVRSITDQCISFSCIFIIVLFVFYLPFTQRYSRSLFSFPYFQKL